MFFFSLSFLNLLLPFQNKTFHLHIPIFMKNFYLLKKSYFYGLIFVIFIAVLHFTDTVGSTMRITYTELQHECETAPSLHVVRFRFRDRLYWTVYAFNCFLLKILIDNLCTMRSRIIIHQYEILNCTKSNNRGINLILGILYQ